MATFKIKSQFDGKVLDIPGFSLQDGTPIQQYDDHDGTNQHWQLTPIDGGFFKIVSQATGKVLDVPGGSHENGVRIQQFQDHGGRNQQWSLVLVEDDLKTF